MKIEIFENSIIVSTENQYVYREWNFEISNDSIVLAEFVEFKYKWKHLESGKVRFSEVSEHYDCNSTKNVLIFAPLNIFFAAHDYFKKNMKNKKFPIRTKNNG